ncbi:hypothetical protein ABID95_002264 [Streptomyces atratus]
MGKVYQRAVMWCPGIIFPTPYPQGYGATPSLPRPPQSACDVPGSMPEAAPYGNAGCVVHRSLREQGTAFGDRRVGGRHRPHAGAAELRHRTLRTEEQHPGAPRRSDAGNRRRGGVQLFTGAGRPRGVRHIRRPVRRYTHRPDAAIRAGSTVPLAACRIPPRPPGHGGVRAQSHRRGCAPVKRRIQTCATIYFQPTSHPCPFLGELADQPPCHQARRDQAVRFHPMGTGHECEAYFPARLLSETLRDRMLPAKLPCRHSPGWSTCHAGTAGRSRFDLGCRRLGTRARPRGNVQERQARKDQGDANTEGGLAS